MNWRKPHGPQDSRQDVSDEPANRETALLKSVCEGNETAFETLYHSYYPRLFRFIFHITGHLESVEEIINEVMLTVWHKATSYNYQCKLSTWIFGIAYKKSLKALKQHRMPSVEFSEITLEDTLPGATDAVMQQFELENWLVVALQALSPEQRAVIELTYYYDLHYHEIAEIIGCPANTVKTRMFHARKKLASYLSDGL